MTKMRLLVVGANGGLGRQVVTHSLERGHQVTALVRRGAGQAETPGPRIVAGAVGDDLAAVRRAVDGQDAIVSALGNPLWLKARTGSAVMARATANLVAAMHLHRVRRIAMPLAWGSGASRRHTAWPLKALPRLLIRRDYQDFDTAEAILTASGLDYTIAYFGSLTDQPASSAWSAHPGIMASDFGRYMGRTGSLLKTAARPFIGTPRQGAARLAELATRQQVLSGTYFVHTRPAKGSAQLHSRELGTALWEAANRATADSGTPAA
ncbi:NAD(P)H-binding protein [Streptomyces solisilvae]|uniref:NAD(P)H-binding protein n=1 Tax=Streptomyces malaysiensis TaxID=92644 RepID=UPI0036BD09C6